MRQAAPLRAWIIGVARFLPVLAGAAYLVLRANGVLTLLAEMPHSPAQ